MIGIDLGTTNSVVAIWDDGAGRVLSNREGQWQTRSVVAPDLIATAPGSGELSWLVGNAALAAWADAPQDTIISIKRLMGRGFADREVRKARRSTLYRIVAPADGTRDSLRVVIAGKEYPPVEISAIILRRLKQDAERALGEPVSYAVVTVPAYFSQAQKAATREAGELAGLRVIKVLEEPTAAAIALGVNPTGGEEPQTVVVFDLGGGTFDVSVLTTAGTVFAPLDLEGDMWLGGDNFTRVLVEHAARHLKSNCNLDPAADKALMARLQDVARRAKEALSSTEEHQMLLQDILPHACPGASLSVTRVEYETLITPLVDRTMELTERALDNAGLVVEDVDQVVLAGGATKVPIIRERLAELFGAERLRVSDNPKQSVALGAAMVAARLGEIAVCGSCGHVNDPGAISCTGCGGVLTSDLEEGGLVLGGIAPFHYGAQTSADRFNIFVEKGDPFPTAEPRAEVFYTVVPRQRMLSVPIYGGEDVERASINEKQGEAFAILPPGLPKSTPVRISLWLDGRGELRLDARLGDGVPLQPWLTRGEADAQAIEMLQHVEAALASRELAAPVGAVEAIEGQRARIFAMLRAGRYLDALAEARQLEAKADALGPHGDLPLPRRAETAARNLARVVRRYGWALQADERQLFDLIIEEPFDALEAGDLDMMQRKLDVITAQLKALPELIQVLINAHFAITGRVRSVDPRDAAELEAELDGVESAVRERGHAAEGVLNRFLTKLAASVLAADQRRPGGAACPQCGTKVAAGQRICPQCGADTWAADARVQ